jgi:diaminopimelate epimerase
MHVHFYKYEGTGNDFIVIDDRDATFPQDPATIARLCHRRFGIGADGLLLLQKHPTLDFRMVYFNADGNEGSMCGNGGRCIVQFAHDLGIAGDNITFEASDGFHEAQVSADGVRLRMIDVTGVREESGYSFLDTGSPHYVEFVANLRELDVVTRGKTIRHDAAYRPYGGTNVNFAEVQPDHSLFIRTYERGVEAETYSCGTGVTACAIAASLRYPAIEPTVNIRTVGGTLQVYIPERPGRTGI